MSAPASFVVVLRTPYAAAYPHSRPRDAIACSTDDVLTRGFSTDAHFAAYAPATDPPSRLANASLKHLGAAPRMVLLVVDVDPPGHVASDGWRAEIAMKAAHAPDGPFGFWTRNGARFVWTIDPFVLETAGGWSEWYLWQLVAFAAVTGIVADPCCADWTRLHRAPHATRDREMLARGWVCGTPTSVPRWRGIDVTEIERAAALGWLIARSSAWRHASVRLIERPAPSLSPPPSEGNSHALRWAVQQVEKAGPGARNETLYKVARWLRDKATPTEIDAELIHAAARAGLAMGEARRTIASALVDRTIP